MKRYFLTIQNALKGAEKNLATRSKNDFIAKFFVFKTSHEPAVLLTNRF